MIRKLPLPLIIAVLTMNSCTPDAGSKVTIAEQCTGAVSSADFKEMWNKSSDSDLSGLQEMLNNGKVYVIPASTEGTVIEKETNLIRVEVSIQGQVHRLWVASENIQ